MKIKQRTASKGRESKAISCERSEYEDLGGIKLNESKDGASKVRQQEGRKGEG